MNRELPFNRWGIHQRALFLALAPLLLVSLIIGYYLTNMHLQTAQRSLEQRGLGIAKNLAQASEFGLTVGDQSRIEQLLKAAMVDPDVHLVEAYDAQGKLIASDHRDGTNRHHKTLLRGFTAFVMPSALPDTEIEEFRGTAQPLEPLGRIVVWISTEHLKQVQRSIINKSLLIVSSGALLAALLGLLIARGLTKPVKNVISAVDELSKGNLEHRVRIDSRGELGKLEEGINHMADALESSQRMLEVRVQDATQKLANNLRELRRKNEELEAARLSAMQASEAKANFLAQISHELRTPLNAILGFSRLLLKHGATEGQTEYLKIINQAGDQLLTVINDVLSFSKLESGQMEIHPEHFDPHDTLEEVVGLLSHEAHRKELELVLLLHHDVPHDMYSDPSRLAQILINLLNNAVKFTPKGQITVTAEAIHTDAQGAQLQVSVADSGIGISETVAQHLFTPFTQGDSSTTKLFSGTGLGLTISKALCESLGGTIIWRNNLSQGTTFTFRLPGLTAERQLADSAIPNLAGLKALIVEQNPLSRRAIRNLLIGFKMEVYQQADYASTDNRLHQAAEDDPFDLLVIGLSKAEAQQLDLSAWQTLAKQHDLGIVLLIGDEELANHYQEMNPLSHIQITEKPVRRKILYQKIIAALEIVETDTASLPPANEASSRHTGGDVIRALVGDDNAFGRRLLADYLASVAAKVVTAKDGREVLDIAQQQPFDIIFLDLHMPEIDGITVASKLQADPGPNQSTPLIAVTADVFFDALETQQPSPFQAVLHKPVTHEQITEILHTWLAQLPHLPPEPAATPTALTRPQGLRMELDTQLQALQDALHEADRERLHAHAHQLNGITRFFQIHSLSSAARELESCALSAGETQLADLVSQIVQAAQTLEWDDSAAPSPESRSNHDESHA